MPFAATGPPWTPGTNKAVCYDQEKLERTWPLFDQYSGQPYHAINRNHQAPEPQCECGFYAWHQPSTTESDSGLLTSITGRLYLTGSILGRGRVEIHESGFRAEEVTLLALHLEPSQQLSPWQTIAESVAAHYKVRLFDAQEPWQRFSEGYGTSGRSLWSR